MPQANDAQLTELYTAATGEEVENDEPNASSTGPVNNFDLRLQAVAGNVIGDSGGDYTLRADCIDETEARRVPGMSLGPVTQQFDANSPNDWEPSPAGNFVKEQTANISVDPGARGHVLRYVASLVSVNGDVVSFIESNRFILI
ncbi:MAG TPA: hypothetical protein VL330_26340 [Actinomycetes bacterium]|nr:hypothetical protein [Actinomycetes bacterium]